jgi:heparin binding hemagglutinin HbhA
MTEQTNTKIPAPLYAAAGAGDLAYQQLRKLPAVLTELSDRAVASLRTANVQAGDLQKKATELQTKAAERATELQTKAATTDFAALRTNATTAATAFAQIAQERALTAYTALVARGEKVVGSGVIETAEVVNADIETTEQPKAVEAVVAEAKAVESAPATPKPRKRAKAAPAPKPAE